MSEEEKKIKTKAAMLFLKAMLCDSMSAMAELVQLVEKHQHRID